MGTSTKLESFFDYELEKSNLAKIRISCLIHPDAIYKKSNRWMV
ncbi:hypothetical protein LSS_14612 [Leptospira santarosai serovar Shermani str. LT 821]|uniref:Uncharacterized protein n=1 Tax=Leptospira santarosai serovar Shermani str. LT 821 TaxID=758847 RepID=K8XWU6_9LEPT|nr:hypothetical protein LSS_14612 [Leptospira santarosai serovar Shermani str. LT 821]